MVTERERERVSIGQYERKNRREQQKVRDRIECERTYQSEGEREKQMNVRRK